MVQLSENKKKETKKSQEKKGFFSRLLDEADEKIEKRSQKSCCGKGGCCK